MKRKNRVAAFLSMGLAYSLIVHGQTMIKTINFEVKDGASLLDIQADGPLVFDQTFNEQDNQLVIDIDEARLGPNAIRKLDTSSFDSPVSLVSPYAVGEDGSQVRVVVQFREKATPNVTGGESSIKVNVARAVEGEAPPQGQEIEEDPLPEEEPLEEGEEGEEDSDLEGLEDADDIPPEEAMPEDRETVAMAKPGSALQQEKKKNERAQSNIQMFMDNRKTKNFRGSPVTLQVRDAEVQDVLRLISEASGFNIIVGPGVSGKLTLSLIDVPWDQALDVILHTLKLGAERNYNVLRILTLSNLTAEKKQELAAKQAAEATAPQITRVFPVSYADLDELAKVLNTFRKSNVTGLVSGTIETDERTNSIIVQDIGENLDRMAKLLELLDTQTPQVMIEAKIVEATEQSAFNIAGQFGFADPVAVGDAGQYFASFNGVNPIDNLIGEAGATDSIFTGSDISELATGGSFGIQPQLGFLPGSDRLTAILQVGSSENKLKVVSSPKTVVLNKETAKIVQSIPVLIRTTTIAENGGFIEGSQIQDANISLEVEPTVTNDENVLMELKISRDIPQAAAGGQDGDAAIGKRNIETKVLVQSGSTLVIGGIYIHDRTEGSQGFPILKDIPIIGVLFGANNETVTRSELFIFVTPRILNTKKAGLAS